jgi:hypothetical protein
VNTKVEDLSPAQWEEVFRLRGEWLAAGMCCDPADRDAAEVAITRMYRLIHKGAPRFVWVDSPATAVLAIWLLAREADTSLQAALRVSLTDSLWGSLGRSLRVSLGRSLGDSLRVSLRVSLWGSLAGSLAGSLRGSLEDSLWGSLADSLEDSLWGSLWGSLRSSLPDFLVTQLREYFAGQHETYWVAFYDVPRRLGITTYTRYDNELLDLWATLARSCGWWLPFTNICVISGRPSAIRTETWDTRRGTIRLHCADGPALTFPDGWPVYAWHGRRVPAWVIEDPTPEKIAAERNTEIRRCAIESLGWAQFITAAGLTPSGDPEPDPGNPGQRLELYDVPERIWGTPVRVLLCTNGSPERDGTRRKYGLTVPATISGPLEAAAWTAGLAKNQYARMTRRT